jgi:hypothetical protein
LPATLRTRKDDFPEQVGCGLQFVSPPIMGDLLVPNAEEQGG